MRYEETLRVIYDRGRFGIKPGLERITSLLQTVGNPHAGLPAIQVAGTNGKGSTSAFLASILAEAGLKVGLYTSPHLSNFTERIRINGMEISRDEVVDLANRLLSAGHGDATFFEIVTAMALLHFQERKVDMAVLEAGMGGRFDATNAVSGLLSVITPIGLDHCEYLGEDITAIAGEKAGMIKPGRPVVVAPQTPEAMAVLVERSHAVGAPLYRFGEHFSAEWEGDRLLYHGINSSLRGILPGIGGYYQSDNAATAMAAAEVLSGSGIRIPASAVRDGIEQAIWPGRMETVGNDPLILLDGAHNPAGVTALVTSLSKIPREKLIVVVGIMGDKDIRGILPPLLAVADVVVAVSPQIPRALPSSNLAGFCLAAGKPCRDGGSVSSGLSLARELARAGDAILVTGSLFTVGEARSLLVGRTFEPMRG